MKTGAIAPYVDGNESILTLTGDVIDKANSPRQLDSSAVVSSSVRPLPAEINLEPRFR